MTFCKVGIDLIKLLSMAPGSAKFAVVAVNYFTKWVEVEPFAKITHEKITRFIWKNIICYFGLPQVIISDNKNQFDGIEIDAFFAKWKIVKFFSTPYHLQSNGQVEAVSKIINHTLKISMTPKACGHTSFSTSFSLIEPPVETQLVRHLLYLFFEQKP